MTNRRYRPIELADAPEHRSIPFDRVEIRAGTGSDPNELVLEGYASTYDEYEMYGGPPNLGWIERIDPKAFDVTLREKPDLHFLINHAGMPLARTKSGNLDLCADGTGLKVTARLDQRDPDVQALAIKMERGDMDEMSFAFRVKGQEWRAAEGYEGIDEESYRTITEVSLHKGDVSVVNWGANSNTSAGIRSAAEAIKVLADCDESEFAEIRDDDDTLKRAVEKLAAGFGKAPVVPVVNIETLNVHTDDEDKVEPEARTDDEPEGDKPEDEKAPLVVHVTPDEALSGIFAELVERIAEIETLIGVEKAEEKSEEVDEEKPRSSTRLDEALAAQGILPEKLSLAAALVFED